MGKLDNNGPVIHTRGTTMAVLQYIQVVRGPGAGSFECVCCAVVATTGGGKEIPASIQHRVRGLGIKCVIGSWSGFCVYGLGVSTRPPPLQG